MEKFIIGLVHEVQAIEFPKSSSLLSLFVLCRLCILFPSIRSFAVAAECTVV